MRLYAITDRRLFADRDLLRQAEAWGRCGVEWVQIREKDLEAQDLVELTRRLVSVVRQAGTVTRVVVNASPEMAVHVAQAARADGIHLAAGWSREVVIAARVNGLVSVACHSVAEVVEARKARASVVVFAPVFEKPVDGGATLKGLGLSALHEACAAAGPVPVFALGGVAEGNARSCVEVGAAGVAGIRLFAGEGWRSLVAEV